MPETRRRLDTILDPSFVEGLDDLSFEQLRDRREMVDHVETELSYYRRLLHGRMDLLEFEQRRRRGEESRTLIEALPEILAGTDQPGGGKGRSMRGGFAPPLTFEVGRRQIDRVLEDGFLANLPATSDEELATVAELLAEAEREISHQRSEVHAVHASLQAEISERYAADASS
jgi:hypothetical protein